jgi:hypothetical protein
MRGLDRISYIFAVPVPHFTEHAPVGRADLAAVALVGTNLLPADE